MSLGAFSVSTINLTSKDLVTGLNNTANVYFVPGLGRELSIAELVIAICLDRAASLESDVVGIMEEMSATTKDIEELTRVEGILTKYVDSGITRASGDDPPWACDWGGILENESQLPAGCGWRGPGWNHWTDWVRDMCKLDSFPIPIQKENFSADEVDKACSVIETRLDALNTTSQETLIKLQSLTNKRDQTYDLITAMTKNTLTAAQSIGSNMR